MSFVKSVWIFRKYFVKSTHLVIYFVNRFKFTKYFQARVFGKCVIGSQCSVENREIISHQYFFREISSLVTSLVKTLLSRNFCQKCVRVKFHNFHSTVHCAHCGNYTILLPRFSRKNFVINFLLKKFRYSKLIWRKKIWVAANFLFFHNVVCTVWKSTIKSDHTEKFREINSLVTYIVKTLIWRKKCWFLWRNSDRVS